MANKIKINPLGFVLLRIEIKPNNSELLETITYKVDTGANCTTISYVKLADLGYDEAWIKSGKMLTGNSAPTVASGLPIENCYEVILPEIRIGDLVGYNWPILTSLSVPFNFYLVLIQ